MTYGTRKMNKSLLLLTTIAITAAPPAFACIALFGPCADAELPMSADTFQVNAKGGGWLINPSPNDAVLQSAARGCAARGYPQFIIAGAQSGHTDSGFRYYNFWLNGYGGAYGTSANVPPRQTTSAVIKCARAGGISVQQYLSAND
jgi:hypothetical protein